MSNNTEKITEKDLYEWVLDDIDFDCDQNPENIIAESARLIFKRLQERGLV
jgi:hypothetical protein